MIEDSELLHRYVRQKSEAAFAEVVKRYINSVYAGALRRVGGDVHLAQDVTQRVFTALATAADDLAGHPALAGWLHLTTRNIAAQLVRTERRRAAREQEAHTMNESATPEPSADWEQLRPVIDDTLDELEERDRTAVILRYFEGRSLAEVGATLQLTENAARMRVDRALDRMHGLLARRGVTSTIGALTLALSSQAQVIAPAGLAASVTGGAVAGAATGSAALTFLTFMTTAKIITAITGAVAAAAIGVALHQSRETSLAKAELDKTRHELSDVSARLQLVEENLQAQLAKVAVAEKDTDILLSAIDRAQTVAERPAAPVTQESVQARYRHALELARAGNWETALPELLWCYDEGMVRVASFRGVRASFLLGEIARIGGKYPPAMAALRDRRDRAEQQMLASANEMDAAADLAALNAALGEDSRNLALFDQLPVNDPRRQGLMVRVYDQLLTARRYGDAAEGRPLAQMLTVFDAMTVDRPLPPNMPNAEGIRRMARTNTVTTMAKNVEVLAGAGQIANARLLANKVLAYENTAETRAIIQQHAIRAGHPELLNGSTVP